MAEARQPEDVTNTGLTEDYSCGYCLQRLLYMTDPRELPCSHVFCLSCLQEEFTKWSGVNCGICQQTHDIKDLGSLPKARLVDSSQEPVESEFCDVCEETPTKAASFCVDCGKKLCEQHLKLHDESQKIFFKRRHNIISVDDYMVEPGLYKTVSCTEHVDYPLRKVCSACYKTFCNDCDTEHFCETRDPSDESSLSHKIQSLSKLAKELRNSLTDDMKTLSEKVTDLCKIEKEAWNQLSEVEDDVIRMRETVDTLTEAKISAIREESEEIKAEIQDYLDESTNKVEVFVSELMAKKEDMESLWKTTRQLMKNYHDSELVGEYEDLSVKVKKANGEMHEPCRVTFETLVFPVTPLIEEGGYFKLRWTYIPSGIEFRGEKEANVVYSVKIAKDGRILCGTNSGAQIRDVDTLEIIQTQKEAPISQSYDIIQPLEGMFSLIKFESESGNYLEICEMNPSSLEIERKLFRVNQTGGLLCHIAQHGSDIYHVDTENRKLVVYSLISEDDAMEFPIDMANPFAICALPDSSLLIGSSTVGGLTKYKLYRESGLEKAWASPVEAHGIAYDPNSGLIYTAYAKFGVCIISPEGVLLRKLAEEEFMKIETVHDIAISGDQIILACRNEGLQRFTIKY